MLPLALSTIAAIFSPLSAYTNKSLLNFLYTPLGSASERGILPESVGYNVFSTSDFSDSTSIGLTSSFIPNSNFNLGITSSIVTLVPSGNDIDADLNPCLPKSSKTVVSVNVNIFLPSLMVSFVKVS